MKAGIIDVGGWQTEVCMQTGRNTEIKSPQKTMLKEILDSRRYPGDQGTAAIPWITDIAGDLFSRYHPDYLMLTYATPYFLKYNEGLNGEGWKEICGEIMTQIRSFCENRGIHPIIVGTGDMIPYQGMIDLTGLSGLADAGGPVQHLAAVQKPTDDDIDILSHNPSISGIHTRDDIAQTFHLDDYRKEKIPDLLLIAEEGYTFKALGTRTRPCRYLPGQPDMIPVTGLSRDIPDITGIAGEVISSLNEEKTALVIIEGFGPEELSGAHMVSNAEHWWKYTISGEMYLAITTGKHISEQPYPPGYRGFDYDGTNKPYPFSGYINQIPQGTIGQLFPGRSASVGTRSIFTHFSSGTDITIECKVCNQYNHGSMAVLSEKVVSNPFEGR